MKVAASPVVLIVEDESVTAMFVKLMLQRLGAHAVATAASGEEALEMAESLKPTLAVLDICLGEGIDGIETARRLKESHAVEVVFLSAYSDAEIRSRAMAVGPLAYLLKPLDVDRLQDVLQTLRARSA
ncbi:response regulator receiver protein [Desulfovibrio sp. X2]|uniref:response regulator n=1 Tax=Desulfovibrio sp. X2 TaxID=941449 RepID=UPI0003589EC3|nr:response regulator [Desulfovibrio sp. X2]EPR39845.1 response regulator receiver protein [Desulfovibrio sp. X2]